MTLALPSPPLIGADAQFAALRDALTSAGYTEEAICRRVGIAKIFDFRLEGEAHIKHDPPDALGKLIHLLLEGGAIAVQGAESLPWKELEDLGFIISDPTDPGRRVSTALLYPVLGMYAASDRSRMLPGQSGVPLEHAEDVVYPGIVANTGVFLNLIPTNTPCDAFLDLCAGTGVAALAAARGGARHAYAYDITQRATHYAEFNRRLNGLANVTAARGDLYEPAGELTFDRIAVHPPYLPVFRRHAIYDSGGQDGEQIVRRIIEGLPRYLRPGGRFYALTMGTDRAEPFEQRVREWLGEQQSEFDTAMAVRRTLNPHEYVAQTVAQYGWDAADVPVWRKFFADLGVKSMAYGLLMIQRRIEPRGTFTVRRQSGSGTGRAELQWLLDWETALARSGPLYLLNHKLRSRQGVTLEVKHKLEGQDWVPESLRLDIDYPFEMELRAQAWAAQLMHHADGSLTGAQLLHALIEEGAVAPDTPPEEFAKMLALMVSGGYLQIAFEA